MRDGHRCKHLNLLSTVFLVFLALANSRPISAAEDKTTETERASQKAQCAEQLRAFVAEIDQLLPTVRSSDRLDAAIKRHFPLRGCDIEEALEICRQSKYFYKFDDSYPKGPVAFFFKYRIPHGWGFEVSFGLTKPAGDSRLPSASVDKTGL
jgi:hypothetical protein